MSNIRYWAIASSFVAFSAAPAIAGIGERLFQGLDFLATPSGSPAFLNATGQRINGQRVGRVRAVPNDLGGGYRLEFDRQFGLDALGRPEVLDLGPFEMELSGAIQATASYTTRGFLSGNLDMAASNLNYSIRGVTGAQDFDLSGTLNAAGQMSMNQFGFYSFNVDVDNINSQLTLDGMIVDGDLDSDFNVGPITLEGNLFVDIALAALASFGVDTSGIAGAFPSSPIDRITQEIQARLATQAQVLGEQYTAADFGLDPLTSRVRLDSFGPIDGAGSSAVPEPSTIVLLIAGAALAVRRR